MLKHQILIQIVNQIQYHHLITLNIHLIYMVEKLKAMVMKKALIINWIYPIT